MTIPNISKSWTLSRSSASYSRIMSDSLRPIWCIQRSDNNYVPLIAIDELPDSVRLIGVPATMTMKEVVNAGLACKGEQNTHGKCYQLEPSEPDVYSTTSQCSQSEGTATPPRKSFLAPDMKAAAGKTAKTGKDTEKQPKPDEVQVQSHPLFYEARLPIH